MSMKYFTKVTPMEVNVSVIEPGRFFQYGGELYIRLAEFREICGVIDTCPCICVDNADGTIIYMHYRTKVGTIPVYSNIAISNS